MPAKTSREVAGLEKSCLFVLSAIVRLGARVAEQLQELVHPSLEEGDEEAGFRSSIAALANYLKVSLDRLVAADERIYAANAKLDALRKQRDQLLSAVYLRVRRLRSTLRGQYVAPDLERIGIESPTERSPIPLLRQAERIVENFAGDEIGGMLGEPVFEKPLDLSDHVDEVAAAGAQLRANARSLDDGLRELQEAVVRKNRHRKAHGQIFLHTARTFEAWCRLVNENELADRLRPSARRPGRTAQEVEQEEGSTGDGAAEDAEPDAAAVDDGDLPAETAQQGTEPPQEPADDRSDEPRESEAGPPAEPAETDASVVAEAP